MAKTAATLATEMRTYQENLPSWTAHEGRFVVIGGTEVVGFHHSYHEALEVGYKRFGVTAFLVKQVRQKPVVHLVTRFFAPAAALAILLLAAASAAGRQPETWRGLRVAPENRCSPYDAADYRYPQSVELEIIDELGGVYGPYSDRWFDSRYETDIEHMVARSEAHDSGLCAQNPEIRRLFASDTLNLTLAAPYLNRYEKRAKDAAEWLPDYNRCWFAERVIAVRQKYRLTIDQAETRALDRALASCGRR